MRTVILLLAVCFLTGAPAFASEAETEELWLQEQIREDLDLAGIEEGLRELTQTDSFSFTDAVAGLLAGEIPLEPKSLLATASDLCLGELKRQRSLAIQILAVALASAVFSNFVRIFENSQISDISFYMQYLMISVLLMNAFSGMAQLVADTCSAMNQFMKLLLPSYLLTIVLSSGTVTAMGLYEITLLAVQLLQLVIMKAVLPAIQLYLLTLLLNQLSGEDFFSKFSRLFETVISWTLKTVMGLVLGLQAVQCLISPAVDVFKNTALHRLARVIPGVGSLLDAAAETVAGSAILIKNAVGAAGIFALGFLCLAPLLRLAVCTLLFRALCAVIQPVCDRRMVEGIESLSKGAVLLLRVLFAALLIFVVSFAMITAAIRQ